jgi:DHA1 family tetracycline resistance protein-like MFS transporter
MAKEKASKGSLLFIFTVILVDVMGIAIIIPVIPTLIKELTGQELNDAGLWGGLLISSFAFMQFLFAPLMGELSDKFGRRPILFIALAGLGADYIFHAFAPTLAWLFVGRMLAGVCGASHTVATAYIADISTPENKAKNFGMIGAAFGLGFFLGPMIGGFCAQWGYQVPFFVAAALALANLVWGIFVLPESLPKEKRREIDWKRVIPGVSLANLRKYRSLGLFVVAFTLVHLAGQVMPSTWSFFTMEAFGWGEAMVGISLGVVGLLVGIVQGGLIGFSVKKFGQNKVIMMGFIFWTVGMFSFAIAGNQTLFFIALVPYVLGGIAGPTLQSLMSNFVPDNEQGNLQGALTSMISLTAIIGPLLYTSLFHFFADKEKSYYFPAAPFLAGGIILIFATIVAWMAIKKNKVETELV